MDGYVLTHFFTGIIVRPGEQSIPTGEMGKSPLKRRRNQAINELQNLKYLPRRYFQLLRIFKTDELLILNEFLMIYYS